MLSDEENTENENDVADVEALAAAGLERLEKYLETWAKFDELYPARD